MEAPCPVVVQQVHSQCPTQCSSPCHSPCHSPQFIEIPPQDLPCTPCVYSRRQSLDSPQVDLLPKFMPVCINGEDKETWFKRAMLIGTKNLKNMRLFL